MLANIKIPYIEYLKTLRAETNSNKRMKDQIQFLSNEYINKQDKFKSIIDLNKYMSELNDTDFETFVGSMLDIMEAEDRKN